MKGIQYSGSSEGRRPGLADRGTARTVEEALRQSTPREIDSLLQRIDHTPQPSQSTAASKYAAEQFLSSAQGRAQVDECARGLRNQAAKTFIDSEEGRAALDHCIAVLLSRKVGEDDNVRNKVCRDEAERKAKEWLDSPRGQESVRQILQRAIIQKIREASHTVQREWTQSQLDQVDR